jgi:2,4-dienoyl-CoA reductase-like NADH-dependent reductase (Old Yellow Enzyme family)
MSIETQKLFSPVQLGAISLSHRVVMAPLTRQRSEQPGDVPGPLMVEYYTQRASEGGLVISEATTVAITGRGYLGAPGIYSDEQVAGWKKVVDAVHAKGGRMLLQLWHVGRVAHADMTGGEAPVGPSVVPFEGIAYTKNGWVPVSPHRALKIGMSDTNPDATFGYAAKQLDRYGLAYLHLIEPRIKGNVLIEEGLPPVAAAAMRKIFHSKIVAAGGFEPASAEAILERGDADLVAFGRHFIANPDLPKRIKLGLPLNPYDRQTFYGGDAHGYTDYPFYSEAAVV